MTLQEILDKITSTNVDDLKLFFITRMLKENIKKSSKVMDKYLFKVYQVDINDEIRQHLYDLSKEQLDLTIKKNFEMIEYDVISDDTEHLFTYSMKNKVSSFADVVTNQLQNSPDKMQSIEAILQNNDELWAYCVGFNDLTVKDWIYTFRKIQSGKVAVDEREGKSWLKIIRTYFDTKNQKLELLKGETVNLDKQIDCIYYDEIFYVIKKGYFEQIVGLQEEYKEEAKKVVEQLKQTNKIKGFEKIEEQIETTPSLHKKLVRIAKIGNYRNIDDKIISKMKKVCKKYGDDLKTENGNLLIEDEKDIDVVLKMLADYYKTGDVSGKPYGTFSGKEIKALN
jgi:hypothetical protein